MRVESKLIKIHNSFYALIPNEFIKENNLIRGDSVEFDLLKPKEIIFVVCPYCLAQFESKKEDVYDCINCDKEFTSFQGENL